MPVLTAVVVLIGLIGALNLVLMLGVIKRLREHAELIGRGAGRGAAPTLDVGEPVGAFTVTTVDGDTVDTDHLAVGALIGFFSPRCRPCREKLPDFVRHAGTVPGGRRRVLAVVVGDEEEAAADVAALEGVARVVREPEDGPLGTAFRTRAYPTVLRVAAGSDGRVRVTDNHVDLTHPAEVTA
ncbi:hypothetical protein [Streptomyces sp. TRM64462]|uniref:TlpA family protein disulfide reductase n=1 Tax=Streptomyces sp. TRM64462 TaxID=2741726 RepID=UPI00158660C1|nr:hypothetical protein [Streptomyces sp. TRM64462]